MKLYDPGKAPKGNVTVELISVFPKEDALVISIGVNPKRFPQDVNVFPHSSARFQKLLNPGAFPE